MQKTCEKKSDFFKIQQESLTKKAMPQLYCGIGERKSVADAPRNQSRARVFVSLWLVNFCLAAGPADVRPTAPTLRSASKKLLVHCTKTELLSNRTCS